MENHYHSLLKTIDPNPSKAMQWIDSPIINGAVITYTLTGKKA